MEFLKALILIFMAEMGDKTQILAMALATKYRFKTVILGISLGAFLNHFLAVAFGNYLKNFISLDFLQIIAGISFVIFSLTSLKIDSDENNQDENLKNLKNPIFSIAFLFFVGELGDKTQLSAISLSLDCNSAFMILLGTVSGMILTSIIGILIGKIIGNKIKDYILKSFSSILFMFFGIEKLNLCLNFLNPRLKFIFFSILITILCSLIVLFLREYSNLKIFSKYQVYAQNLNVHYKKTENLLDLACLNCKKCQKTKCCIGYSKSILKEKKFIIRNLKFSKKPFDKEKLIAILVYILKQKNSSKIFDSKLLKIKKALELFLFKNNKNFDTLEELQKELQK